MAQSMYRAGKNYALAQMVKLSRFEGKRMVIVVPNRKLKVFYMKNFGLKWSEVWVPKLKKLTHK